MKIEQNLYEQAMMDSRHISQVATQLEFMSNMEKQGVLNAEKVREDYEESRLRDIKNLLSNIYLTLDLHEIRGMADEIFNPNFNKND